MARFQFWLNRALRNPGSAFSFIRMLPTYFKLLSRLMRDSRVALLPKLLFLAALIYLISPLDLIPDFIFPIIGWSDDFFIVLAAAKNLISAAPPDVVQEHLAEIKNR